MPNGCLMGVLIGAMVAIVSRLSEEIFPVDTASSEGVARSLMLTNI